MAANGGELVSVLWNPETDGIYNVKLFVISSFETPTLLSDLIQQTRISIDGVDVAVCSGSANCFVDTVTGIVDGDTLDVGEIRIRLALTNTPEINEDGYDDAKDFTSALCPVGSEVLVDQDDVQLYDDFGRMLAKVTCGDAILNAELLDEGHTNILTEYCAVSEFSLESWAQEHGCRDEDQEEEVEHIPPASPPPETEEEECDPSYPTVCIPPPPPDLDCPEIPYRNFEVLEPDPHHFDGDNDGIGCET